MVEADAAPIDLLIGLDAELLKAITETNDHRGAVEQAMRERLSILARRHQLILARSRELAYSKGCK